MINSIFNIVEKGIGANSGFYQVNDQRFNHKLEALSYASRGNFPVYWNFHDQVFKNFNWTAKPFKTISQVYKERAQQLRDQYDYISISFSGGSDSWNVLNSFLSNNIHVDEVFTRFALSGTRKWMPANTQIKSATNYTSEYEFAVKPVLDYVAKNFPKTKITVVDITESYFDEFTEEEILRAGQYVFNGMSAKRCLNQIGLDVDYLNKKVASIRGNGKPIFFKKNNEFFIMFNEMEAWPVDCDPHLSLEYFYWTPNMPEVVATQAHTMADFFRARPDLWNVIEGKSHELQPGKFFTVLNRTADKNLMCVYEELVKSICYPEWNTNTFQVGKNDHALYAREEDFWILNQNIKSIQSWKWAVNQYYSVIDKNKYFFQRGEREIFLPFISPFYKIGSI